MFFEYLTRNRFPSKMRSEKFRLFMFYLCGTSKLEDFSVFTFQSLPHLARSVLKYIISTLFRKVVVSFTHCRLFPCWFCCFFTFSEPKIVLQSDPVKDQHSTCSNSFISDTLSVFVLASPTYVIEGVSWSVGVAASVAILAVLLLDLADFSHW